MVTREQFYEMYDSLMPQICEPYEKFLSIVANTVPKDTESICD